MDPQLTALTMLPVPFLLVCQWWWMRKRWMLRLHAVQASHARYKARAEVLIELTKQRTKSLQHQLTGHPKPLSASDLTHLMEPVHEDAEVIVLADDGTRTHVTPFRQAALA